MSHVILRNFDIPSISSTPYPSNASLPISLSEDSLNMAYGGDLMVVTMMVLFSIDSLGSTDDDEDCLENTRP